MALEVMESILDRVSHSILNVGVRRPIDNFLSNDDVVDTHRGVGGNIAKIAPCRVRCERFLNDTIKRSRHVAVANRLG